MSLAAKVREQLISSFRAELTEHVQIMTDGLLALEQGRVSGEQRQSTLENVFHAAHSLKGAAHMAGVAVVEQLAHALEDLLDAMRNDAVELSPELFTACYQALDAIQAAQTAYESGEITPPAQASQALADLEPFLSAAMIPASGEPVEAPPMNAPEVTLADTSQSYTPIYWEKVHLSIQMKIALWAGMCLILAAAIIIGYAAVSLRNTAIDKAEEQALAMAKSYAMHVEAEIEAPFDAARTLAQILSAVKNEEAPLDLSREEGNVMLKEILVDNPQFLGVWTAWEPNAFDGQDAEHVSTERHDQTGRFLSYWSRNEAGEIRLELSVDPELTDRYQLSKETKQECILAPDTHLVQGKDVLMTSLMVPIMADGEFCGVAAVDLRLEFFQKLAEETDAYDKAKFAIVSNDGTIVGMTGQPGLVGKHMKEYYKDWEKNLAHIQGGKEVAKSDKGRLMVFVPVQVGHTETPWSVNLNVPLIAVSAEASALMWKLIVISVFLVAAALVLLWSVARRIAKPIKSVTDVARAVASGNLEIEVQVESEDETGVLATAFNQMIGRLREMIQGEQEQREYLQTTVQKYAKYMVEVGQGNLGAWLTLDPSASSELGDGQDEQDPLLVLGHQLNETVTNLQSMSLQIREAVSNLGSAATEILAATTQQASGANEQSAAISQTTTTVDEVKTIADQSVARAQEVADASQRTVQVSHSGQQAVQDTITNMGRIKERVEGIAENILALSERTQQIGEIIATVSDIAAQSNILALNASVEAARAGEHGKGFAVVAAEVRNLAKQSRQATAQVRAILSDIQNGINATVMATEEGTKVVDVGVGLAAQTGQVIGQLAGVIDESAQAAVQMVAGGRQQASGIEQIAVAMQNINQATVQSLASTRQAEKAARDLNDLARTLTETVEQYQL